MMTYDKHQTLSFTVP